MNFQKSNFWEYTQKTFRINMNMTETAQMNLNKYNTNIY